MRPNPKRKHQYVALPVWVFLAIAFAALFITFAGWQPGVTTTAQGNRIIPIGGGEIQKLIGVPGVALAGGCGYCGWYSLCRNNTYWCCTQWIQIGCGGGPQSASITGAVTCGQWGAYNWCKSNAQLVLTVSNPQNETISVSGNAGSVPISCTGSCTINLPPGSGTATYTMTASPSNTTSSGSTAWMYDPEPPVPGLNVTGTSGTNGWYISPVTVSAAATDPSTGSGQASGPAGASISVDGGAEQSSATLNEGVHSVIASAIDNAGNTATAAAVAIKVDTTTPLINVSLAGTPGANGWYISDTQISATATDATSGINTIEVTVDGGAWTIYSTPVTLTDGQHTLQFRATDNAGNVTTTAPQQVQVDSTPPVISPSITGTMGSNNWYISDVQVGATATDASSGIDTLEVAVDGGVWAAYTAPIPFITGRHSLQFRATDKAGNSSQAAQTVAVDTNGPLTNMPAAWTLGRTVTYSVTDNESGLASVRVAIKDEKEHFKQLTWHQTGVSGNSFSGEIDWDGKFADGTVAPPGVYQVWVKSTDIAGHKGEALGMVTVEASIFNWFIPPMRTPTATPTATLQPTATATIQPTATPHVSAPSKPVIVVRSGVSGGKSNAQRAPEPPNIPSLPLVSSAVAAMAAYAAYEQQRKREEELARQAAEEEHKADGYATQPAHVTAAHQKIALPQTRKATLLEPPQTLLNQDSVTASNFVVKQEVSLDGSTSLPFGDLIPDASYTSYTFTVGFGSFFWTGSLDFVHVFKTNEYGIFYSPRATNSKAEVVTRGMTDDLYGVTPQIGFSKTEGELWGNRLNNPSDAIRSEGIYAYEGPFTHLGGGVSIVTGDTFTSNDKGTGQVDAKIVGSGLGAGLSAPLPIEAHTYVTESKLLLRIPIGEWSQRVKKILEPIYHGPSPRPVPTPPKESISPSFTPEPVKPTSTPKPVKSSKTPVPPQKRGHIR